MSKLNHLRSQEPLSKLPDNKLNDSKYMIVSVFTITYLVCENDLFNTLPFKIALPWSVNSVTTEMIC